MPGDYISREAFKEEVRRLSTHYLNEWDTLGVLAAADRIPAADVQPVVRGEWIFCGGTWEGANILKCSECGATVYYEERNFCPNCGADMRPPKEETRAELPVHHGTFAAASEKEALERIIPAEEGE